MSPKRYLLLRRMHLVRRALRDSAGQSTTTVTESPRATASGNSAGSPGNTKSLFGELPSATLRRPPEGRRQTAREPSRILAEIA